MFKKLFILPFIRKYDFINTERCKPVNQFLWKCGLPSLYMKTKENINSQTNQQNKIARHVFLNLDKRYILCNFRFVNNSFKMKTTAVVMEHYKSKEQKKELSEK